MKNEQIELPPGALTIISGNRVNGDMSSIFTAAYCQAEPAKRRYVFGIGFGRHTFIQIALTRKQAYGLVVALMAWLKAEATARNWAAASDDIDFESIPHPA